MTQHYESKFRNLNQMMTIKYLRHEFIKYMNKHSLKTAVLGVSGGLDSAFVAALVHPLCIKHEINFIGVSLPSSSNKQEETIRANNILKCFTNGQEIINIDNYVQAFKGIESYSSFEDKIRLGNIKARIRMIILYNIASKHNGLVLGTDNLTEYLLGFWTLHGDVGDLGLIQNLWKTEIYELSQYLVDNELSEEAGEALQECIDAVPTDGLGITSSDIEQFGVDSYAEVDKRLMDYIYFGIRIDGDNVIDRHLKTQFKRNNPYNVEIK